MREPTPGGPWICTYSGNAFFPLDPRSDEVLIEDVAHGLSNRSRFNGMTRVFYSVAEHSVRVARLLAGEGCHQETVLGGLLHDGSEAFLPDVPRPIKLADGFREIWAPIECRVQVAVNTAFGLSVDIHKEPIIKRADNVLLATEKRDLMNADKYEWAGLPDPLDERIVPWTPLQAERRFLALARELMERLK